jgi:T4-like virus tail tube protein gp19.
MGNASQPTPFVNMPVPGDKIEYQDFWMMFSVDEEMKNYREIANWIVGLGFPRQFGQYAELNNSIDSIVADISLFILDSDHQPQHIVYFYNAFPVSLTDITFDTKAQDTVIPMVTATFKYSYWQLDDVNAGTTTMTPADRQ